MVATRPRRLQLFDPPADAVYTIESAAQLTGMALGQFLFIASIAFFRRCSAPELEAIPLMATGFVHCVASRRSAQPAATILPASESFSTRPKNWSVYKRVRGGRAYFAQRRCFRLKILFRVAPHRWPLGH